MISLASPEQFAGTSMVSNTMPEELDPSRLQVWRSEFLTRLKNQEISTRVDMYHVLDKIEKTV
jgi:hypothetical protein